MTGGCWPTAEQTLLLQAAVLDGEAARSAFHAWRARVAADHLDYGSARLLPAVYLNLAGGLDEAEPFVRSMRERYERTVVVNDRRLGTLASLVAALRTAGVDTLVLKGMALVACGHQPAGARPMDDLDLLVPVTQTLTARECLLAEGWRLLNPINRARLSVSHGADLTSPSGDRLDLHWHVLAECCAPNDDEDFWQAAQPVTVKGAATCVLCPEDFLLHVCAHGLRWSVVPPVRWAVDAVTILRAAGPRLDWDRLVRQATQRSLVLPVVDALSYLREALGADVPASATDELKSVTVPPLIVAEHAVRMQPRSVLRQARYHWIRHRRFSGGSSALGALSRYPGYLRRFWGLSSYRDLAGHIVDRLTQS